jgi:hypothetical protein
VEEIIQIEAELGRINVEIESLEGQLRYYTEMTDFASLNISLFVPSEFTAKRQTDAWDSFGSKFSAALINGVNNFTDGIAALILFLAKALPFIIPPIALIVIIALIVNRRRKRRRRNEGA